MQCLCFILGATDVSKGAAVSDVGEGDEEAARQGGGRRGAQRPADGHRAVRGPPEGGPGQEDPATQVSITLESIMYVYAAVAIEKEHLSLDLFV